MGHIFFRDFSGYLWFSITSVVCMTSFKTGDKISWDRTVLTHWGQVTHICIGKLGHPWFRWCLVACLAPSHYLNQCGLIVDWPFRNKLQWNLIQNLHFFIKESACENVVCKMSAILAGPQCVIYSSAIHRQDRNRCIFPLWIIFPDKFVDARSPANMINFPVLNTYIFIGFD